MTITPKFSVPLFIFVQSWIGMCVLHAQPTLPKNRTVDIGMANHKKGDLYLKVTYGAIACKETDEVFGNKVPWRRMWRTGMDDATEITLSDTTWLAGNMVPPGSYALFTIPDTAVWTVILNKVPGQWGLYKYDQKKDLLRVELPMYKSPKFFEKMTVFIEESNKGLDVLLIWASQALRIPFEAKKEK